MKEMLTPEQEKRVRKNLRLIFLTKREKILLLCLLLILLMGWGPGELLANKPVLLLGVPSLYLWWVLWWLPWVAVMYLLIFTSGQKEFKD